MPRVELILFKTLLEGSIDSHRYGSRCGRPWSAIQLKVHIARASFLPVLTFLTQIEIDVE